MYGSLSNESRILNGMKMLSLPVTTFCKLAKTPKTKFIQSLSEPGHAFSDADAARFLALLEKLFNLQLALDEFMKSHVPLNWGRVDQIADVLVIHEAQKICMETGDHSLDHALRSATKSVAAIQ